MFKTKTKIDFFLPEGITFPLKYLCAALVHTTTNPWWLEISRVSECGNIQRWRKYMEMSGNHLSWITYMEVSGNTWRLSYLKNLQIVCASFGIRKVIYVVVAQLAGNCQRWIIIGTWNNEYKKCWQQTQEIPDDEQTIMSDISNQ